MATRDDAVPVHEIVRPDPARDAAECLDRARELIRARTPARADEERALVACLEGERRFDYARKLLELARDAAEERAGERWAWLTQQHAFCTYKDTDLPTDFRLARAWAILAEAGDDGAETHGLAGSIQKQWWELNGRRQHLERSLERYSRGFAGGMGNGYCAINAAFVLDLLGTEEAAEPGAASADAGGGRREQAAALRRRVIAEVVPGPRPSWWACATLAEAHFGLGEFALAGEWLRRGVDAGPAGWEREATARQLARIFLMRDEAEGDHSAAWDALAVLYRGSEKAVRAAFVGKVGLALSGGGFRASLFHLGVLARLAEADVLRNVEVISCVSGGSIVGAHYYLALKELLETRADDEITRDDYVALVQRVAATFTAGVEGNLRMRILSNPLRTLRMLVTGTESRSTRLARLYERELYARVRRPEPGEDRIPISALKIFPGGDRSFRPREGNWERSNKVPVMVLNATTLNTGHTWQYTASWMGEPPGPIDSDVDGNDWLRRMPYDQAPGEYTRVPLGQAVAASACVPGLFAPLELPGLYPDRTVRLVDGGVHDNQGIGSLVEQECTVVIVSDASGQMTSEKEPPGHGALPVARSNTILQARVRQAQHREMEQRRATSLLRGFAFLHLQRGLPPPAVDWNTCTEPEALFGDRAREEPAVTEYGVPAPVQRALAGIRTDLDAFHRAEAYALMSSGYRMAAHYLREAFPAAPRPGTRAERWFFQQVDDAFDAPGEKRRRLLGLLHLSAKIPFKPWRTGPAAWAATAALLGAAGAVGWAVHQAAPGATPWILRGAGVSAAAGALAFGVGHFRRLAPVARAFGVVAAPLVVLGGWLVSSVYLGVFNRLYLRAGALGMKAPPVPPRPR